jgi:hypothetical protein
MTASSHRRFTIWRVGGAVGFVAAAIAGFKILLVSDPAAAARVDPASVDLSPLDAISPAVWDEVARKRIIFGHQSVGEDIIAGLANIARMRPGIKLRVVDSRDPSAFDQPGLVHTKVGTNEQSDSKLSDFASVLQSPLGQRADIALMKFCYVDLFADGDPDSLFRTYQEAAASFAASNPGTQVVHVTMPLTTVEAGAKARIKRMLGREELGGYAHNRARHMYNTSLRKTFARPGTIFDLARAQSTLPGGARAEFTFKGIRCECLSRGYTHDGGHLNEAGRLAAARDLLLLLAEQCR